MKERRIKILWITPEVLLPIFSGKEIYNITDNRLPEGCKIRHINYSVERDALAITIEHESFNNVPPGEWPPSFESMTLTSFQYAERYMCGELVETAGVKEALEIDADTTPQA